MCDVSRRIERQNKAIENQRISPICLTEFVVVKVSDSLFDVDFRNGDMRALLEEYVSLTALKSDHSAVCIYEGGMGWYQIGIEVMRMETRTRSAWLKAQAD